VPVILALYLGAIVAANLTLARFGPDAAIPVGFLLIGLDLVARDRLHDKLAARSRTQLVAGMGAIIAAGGALSYVLSLALGSGPLVGRIALASCFAFTVAATLDAITYAVLPARRPWLRSAGSNVPAAAADSYLFLALAFPGPVALGLVAGQFVAKSLGGAVWAAILYRHRPAVDG
jgi:uncharacterized PurR-regulated membrane protein YhhQ (DUF165 family)